MPCGPRCCPGIANRGTVTAAERTAEAAVVGARAAMADLLNADAARRRVRTQHDRSDLRLRPHARQGLGRRGRGRGQPARPRRERAALGDRRRGGRRDGALDRLRSGDGRTQPGPRVRHSCPTAPGWSRSPARPTCSAPVPIWPRSARSCTTAGALLLRRRRAPDRARRDRRGRRSAPTSSPARRTSSSARTAEWWPGGSTCSSSCGRTSCCPRPTPCRSGSSSARCPTS